MFKAPLRILIVTALSIATLIGMVINEGAARERGQEIALAMAAVDPRALLHGHYVIVQIREQLPPEAPCDMPVDAQWLALAPSGANVAGAPIHAYAASGPTREAANLINGAILARGTIMCSAGVPASAEFVGAPGWIALDLGIDRFYINQAEAMRIDEVLNAQRATEETRAYALVSIGRDGRARLKGLIIDGQRLELGWS